MRIFKKEILPNGRAHLYLKLLSYNKPKIIRKEVSPNGRTRVYLKLFSWKPNAKFERLWAKRFKGLNQKELTFVIKNKFKKDFGYKLNLKNPKTFNEKMNWEKLYYWNPLMTICADKVKARDYFCEKIKGGEKHLVKQYGVYKSPDEIDFDALPQQFVLKSNWGSGQQIIVKNKKDLDIEAAKEKMRGWMKPETNHYFSHFEHGYKKIEPRIVCEEFLDYEYKLEFFCFNGEPKFFWIVINDKTPDVRSNFYELDWTRMPIVNHYPNFDEKIEKPKCYEEILENAKKMCGDFPFVRCDFYVTKNGYRFSEMTFFHWGAGYNNTWEPAEWDRKIGDMMTLPKKKVKVAEV